MIGLISADADPYSTRLTPGVHDQGPATSTSPTTNPPRRLNHHHREHRRQHRRQRPRQRRAWSDGGDVRCLRSPGVLGDGV